MRKFFIFAGVLALLVIFQVSLVVPVPALLKQRGTRRTDSRPLACSKNRL